MMIVTKKLFLKTKRSHFSPHLKFESFNNSLKINGFKHLIPFGIEIAHKLFGKVISKQRLPIKPNHE
jgi:hypothetical protein